MNASHLRLSLIAIASTFALAACGGGGGGDSSSTGAATPPVTPPAATVNVSGSAPAVSGDPVAGLLIPQDFRPASPGSWDILSENLAVANLTSQSNGAYTKLAINNSSANVIQITSGTVSDVAGDGTYAIGRWTNGVTTSGSLSANQGVHYVVAKPLNLTTSGSLATWNCTLASATKPTAVSGAVAPGTLNSVTANVNVGGLGINSITFNVSVGSDSSVSITKTNVLPGNFLGDGSTYAMSSEFVGTDPSNPMLAIGYALHLPTTGDVNGVAVLQCH
ncbi:hypothetical protein [Pararobbsia alpina]|uniref:hypothetical protein n=1 Tax=Pararobbsia alpina TaxID=621374 RepID=UPI0039A5937B